MSNYRSIVANYDHMEYKKMIEKMHEANLEPFGVEEAVEQYNKEKGKIFLNLLDGHVIWTPERIGDYTSMHFLRLDNCKYWTGELYDDEAKRIINNENIQKVAWRALHW